MHSVVSRSSEPLFSSRCQLLFSAFVYLFVILDTNWYMTVWTIALYVIALKGNGAMTIRAIVFDIGGVLELTPSTGWLALWEQRLGLQSGQVHERLADVWHVGSTGNISLEEVETQVGERLGLDQAQVRAFMDDLWAEYLGELNTELASYFASLRPRYQTALLSNSFVGARSKEQERYQFGALCDLIVYSHEEGMEKPERAIFELTCARLGVRPAEVIFLDDFEPNIVAAHTLGMHAMLFRNTMQAIADIQACLQAHAVYNEGP